MSRRKCFEVADAIFYNKEKVPDKMLYIERVMLSCNTKEQLLSAYKWGRAVINSITDSISDRYLRKYGLGEMITISGRFIRNATAVLSQIKAYYNELSERKMWNVRIDD